jgi:apolipoprotein N-acyltransferase
MKPALVAAPSAGLWLAAVAGGLQALSIAWPGQGQAHGWLQIASLALLAFSLCRLLVPQLSHRQAAAAAARRSAVFAVVWLAGTFWWLHVSMHEVGGLPAWLSVTAVLALASALGLYYVAAAAGWVVLVRAARWHLRPLAASLLFAALWTLAELLRGRWFTGFPWGAGGYAHVDGWLAGAAPWVGVYGIGAIAAWMAMRLAMLRLGMQKRWRAVVWLLLVPAGVKQLPGVDHFTVSAGSAEVELLQANISQTDKFAAESGIRDALRWYGERLLTTRQPLVIAPETALPVLPQHLPPGYWQALENRFATGGQLALVGVPWGDAVQGYSNTLVSFGPQGMPAYRYDKFHLVPFGEFIPTGFDWFVRLMQIPLVGFTRGSVHQPGIAWQGQRLAPNICYEDLFGEELAARFRPDEQPPTAMVNISNIGWFGDTVAVDQHLNISRMRSMELGRPMLRATNTGATAIIDHRGQVQGLLPRFTRGTLIGTFEGRNGMTPYARWASAWGLWPVWGLALLVLAWAGWSARRR